MTSSDHVVERDNALLARVLLHLRSMSPNLSLAENMCIADAIMDYVEAQAEAGGHNTPEEVEMLLEVQRRLRELTQNVEANAALMRSVVLD